MFFPRPLFHLCDHFYCYGFSSFWRSSSLCPGILPHISMPFFGRYMSDPHAYGIKTFVCGIALCIFYDLEEFFCSLLRISTGAHSFPVRDTSYVSFIWHSLFQCYNIFKKFLCNFKIHVFDRCSDLMFMFSLNVMFLAHSL